MLTRRALMGFFEHFCNLKSIDLDRNPFWLHFEAKSWVWPHSQPQTRENWQNWLNLLKCGNPRKPHLHSKCCISMKDLIKYSNFAWQLILNWAIPRCVPRESIFIEKALMYMHFPQTYMAYHAPHHTWKCNRHKWVHQIFNHVYSSVMSHFHDPWTSCVSMQGVGDNDKGMGEDCKGWGHTILLMFPTWMQV